MGAQKGSVGAKVGAANLERSQLPSNNTKRSSVATCHSQPPQYPWSILGHWWLCCRPVMNISDARLRRVSLRAPRHTNNQHSSNEDTGLLFEGAARPHLGEPPTVHDLAGANVMLQISGVTIKTREDRISKFVRLNRLAEEARHAHPHSDSLTITVEGGHELVSEFLDTFELLDALASSIDKPNRFNSKTLVSAARISAEYEHPALHAFCIEKLQGLSLSSVEQVQIARAISLKSWEERAYKQLSEPRKNITKEEALILGMDAYWQVANTREAKVKSRANICLLMILCSCVVMIWLFLLVCELASKLEGLR
ncbi:unnamed protein product [Rhizoctonia solani]|uniref:BTB domain-containing protein n=1 Tax=Rhizoctonia solani TaxID=456999 RepID=A0A8H3BQ07_9AGAM|nr:unnamed protein product [Rhizoctonia solani]